MTKKTTTTKKPHIQNSQPLRTDTEITLVRSLIEDRTGKNAARNEILFYIGITNGIRTNDIVQLKAADVLNKDKTTIIESKTGKKRTVHFPPKLKKQIKEYLNSRDYESEWLFPSYQDHTKHITTQAVYRMFKRIAKGQPKLAGLTAHSMRRTFGYHYYKRTHDIVKLMRIFNHSSQAITLRYIGIEQEEIDNSLEDFDL